MTDRTSAEYEAAAKALFAENGDEQVGAVNNPLFGLGVELMGEFCLAEQTRYDTELRWLSDLRQYKGVYDADQESAMPGSRAFMRKTRVKVESVDARMSDLLFPANRERNYSLEPSPEPVIPKPLREKIERLITQTTGKKPSKEDMEAAVKEAAKTASGRMADRIDDQLAEARFKAEARKVLHSGNLYGTGILKGPLVEFRERVCYTLDEQSGSLKMSAKSYAAPFVEATPIWRWYPDMSVTDLADCRYVWEHHRMSRSKLGALADRKTFDGKAIRLHINTFPDGNIRRKNYEQELRIIGANQEGGAYMLSDASGQYDVYERWGFIGGERLLGCGVKIPDECLHEDYFANIWMLGDGTVIKAQLAPIEGMRWPYHIYYVDKDETSIFGEGFAAIMRGDQEMLNAAVRMLLDNAAVSAGPMFEIMVNEMDPTANLTDIFARKIFPRTTGNAQYPAVRPIDANSHINELMALIQLFDTNADEVTAVPKFTYGDNPSSGAAATARGLSMLLGQANIALKDLVANWDDGITAPFIGGMFHWNMRFSKDDRIKGDFVIRARGAASLVAREIRATQLAEYAATAQPEERQYIKWDKFSSERAEANEMSDIVMDEQEYRSLMESPQMQQQQQMQEIGARLSMAEQEAKVAKLKAEAEKIKADTFLRKIEAMAKKIEAMYEAMNAAGIAVQNPQIAPAGDAMMQSAGWEDATPQDASGAELASMPSGAGPAQPSAADLVPDDPPTAGEGQAAGINGGQNGVMETNEVVQ